MDNFNTLRDPQNTDNEVALRFRAVLRAVKHADMTVESGARELIELLEARTAQVSTAVQAALGELQSELKFWKDTARSR